MRGRGKREMVLVGRSGFALGIIAPVAVVVGVVGVVGVAAVPWVVVVVVGVEKRESFA